MLSGVHWVADQDEELEWEGADVRRSPPGDVGDPQRAKARNDAGAERETSRLRRSRLPPLPSGPSSWRFLRRERGFAVAGDHPGQWRTARECPGDATAAGSRDGKAAAGSYQDLGSGRSMTRVRRSSGRIMAGLHRPSDPDRGARISKKSPIAAAIRAIRDVLTWSPGRGARCETGRDTICVVLESAVNRLLVSQGKSGSALHKRSRCNAAMLSEHGWLART